MFLTLFQVALGGAIGSALRYLTVLGAGRLVPGWPVGTLVVNVAGCFVMGLLFALSGPRNHPLLMTGILGGFTTFSAFSLDTLKLWEGGAPAQAALYTGASVVLSLLACALGAALARGALT
jgi:fluoride exporter